MSPFKSAQGLVKYFMEALQGEYFLHDAERTARWFGAAAKKLGIEGEEVTKEVFSRLTHNLHPDGESRLSPRTRDDRTVAYDLTFSVPKGVSVLYAKTGDERVIGAFEQAVRETMGDIEQRAMTRVRAGGEDTDRTTGNLVWGEFHHGTTRPVDAVPDPHLHAHCIVFNATWDEAEQKYKAGKFLEINREMPLHEAAFDARLALNLKELGYDTERSAKGWDVAGIPEPLKAKFSRRTQEIDALAAKLNIKNPVEKSRLGAKSRKRKIESLSRDELKERWGERITSEERQAIDRVSAGKATSRDKPITAREALDFAIENKFELESATPLPRLLETALRRGVGHVSPEQIRLEAAKHPDLIRREHEGQTFVTTRQVLAEERKMIAFARDGRGSCAALEGNIRWDGPSQGLNKGQQSAIKHVLKSQDRVMLIRGAAGTGKTTLMREAVSAIENRGRRVTVVAPTSEASRGVLRESGFAKADTLEMLLTSPELQAQCRNGVIWCDEAGLVGNKDMLRLFKLAKKVNARVILSGDSRQHKAVQRGESLRVLQTYAGIRPAEVTEVVRQQGTYRRAVEAMSRGEFDKGIEGLDKLKAIKEIDDNSRQAEIARDYAETIRTGRSCLVVAPTHAEGEAITELIRATLKHTGEVSQSERLVVQHRNLGLTTAQKKDAAIYQPGQVIRFHRQVRGFKPGEILRVTDRDAKGRVRVHGTGKSAKPRVLRLDGASSFSVFEERQLRLATGDRIRFTGNGRDRSRRHRINNGAAYKIAGFTPQGHLKLDNGWVVDRDYGQLTHGYTTTSHASQGKSVDRVLISQSWASIGAASAEQVYVSASRGKQSVAIYTDDRSALIEAIRKQSARKSAVEIVSDSEPPSRRTRVHEHAMMLQRLRAYERSRRRPMRSPGIAIKLGGLFRGGR